MNVKPGGFHRAEGAQRPQESRLRQTISRSAVCYSPFSPKTVTETGILFLRKCHRNENYYFPIQGHPKNIYLPPFLHLSVLDHKEILRGTLIAHKTYSRRIQSTLGTESGRHSIVAFCQLQLHTAVHLSWNLSIKQSKGSRVP